MKFRIKLEILWIFYCLLRSRPLLLWLHILNLSHLKLVTVLLLNKFNDFV